MHILCLAVGSIVTYQCYRFQGFMLCHTQEAVESFRKALSLLGTSKTKLITSQEAAQVFYLIGVCYMKQMLLLQVINWIIKSTLDQFKMYLFTFLKHISEYYVWSKYYYRDVAFYHIRKMLGTQTYLSLFSHHLFFSRRVKTLSSSRLWMLLTALWAWTQTTLRLTIREDCAEYIYRTPQACRTLTEHSKSTPASIKYTLISVYGLSELILLCALGSDLKHVFLFLRCISAERPFMGLKDDMQRLYSTVMRLSGSSPRVSEHTCIKELLNSTWKLVKIAQFRA